MHVLIAGIGMHAVGFWDRLTCGLRMDERAVAEASWSIARS
jgi:hypothetical protein